VSAKAYAYTTGSVEGLSALSTDSYTYDTTNKDELTHFGGAFAPCNAMGYHSGYNGYLILWTNGKLSRLTKGFLPIGMHDYNYSYNALGQRVGISYTYTPPRSPSSSPVAMGTLLGYSKSYDYDQSGRLISESRTNEYYGELDDSEKIVFLYDESGMVGFIYTTSGASNTYYYDKNIRGDVLGIYDTNGTRIVKYSYDAWGNCTIDSSTTNTALAKINPIRYRSYYYDEDIKLYYLNSRYYGPLWRRFISPATANALNPESVNGLNLYAYAGNNPVSLAYPSAGKAISQSPASAAHSFANASVERPHRAPINLANGLYALSGAFSAFDYYSGQIATGLEVGTNVINNYIYNNMISLSSYDTKMFSQFGKFMAVTGTVLSIGASIYNNFCNPNYSQEQLIQANLSDTVYYIGKGALMYGIGNVFGTGLAYLGTALTVSIGITGAVGITLVLAIGISILMYKTGEALDEIYDEYFKKKYIG
jgi:RHS repeat-associated protein